MGKVLKFIFVNRFYHPDISASSQMLTDAAEFVEAQHKVHVVTSSLACEGGSKHPARDIIRGVVVHRVWSTNFGRGNLLGRACDYVTFYLSVFVNLLVLVDGRDTVIVKTDPPMVSVPVGLAVNLKGAKLVNWLQDLFPEVAVELGMKIPSFAVSILTWLRNQSLLRAD